MCALLGPYVAWIGKSVPTFRDNLSVPFIEVKQLRFLLGNPTLENGIDRVSLNTGTELPNKGA